MYVFYINLWETNWLYMYEHQLFDNRTLPALSLRHCWTNYVLWNVTILILWRHGFHLLKIAINNVRNSTYYLRNCEYNVKKMGKKINLFIIHILFVLIREKELFRYTNQERHFFRCMVIITAYALQLLFISNTLYNFLTFNGKMSMHSIA